MEQLERVMKYLGGMQDRSDGALHTYYYNGWTACYGVLKNWTEPPVDESDCDHEWVESSEEEPPFDICISCGATQF